MLTKVQLLQDEGVKLVSTTSSTIASDSTAVNIHDPGYMWSKE